LVASLDGAEKSASSVVLPAELVVRRSCGCMQDSDPLVTANPLHASRAGSQK